MSLILKKREMIKLHEGDAEMEDKPVHLQFWFSLEWVFIFGVDSRSNGSPFLGSILARIGLHFWGRFSLEWVSIFGVDSCSNGSPFRFGLRSIFGSGFSLIASRVDF
jgi:hypothetical protein